MARIGLTLFLIVGILCTSYGYELTLAKQIASKIADKAKSLVWNQKQIEVSLDLPENAFPVENLAVPYTCNEDGLFPYPTDCTMGVRCMGGINTIFSCTDVLHFNNVTKKCESFCSAQCDSLLACICGWDSCQSSKETVTADESEADELVKNKLKTAHICPNDGAFPNPTDCNKFIYCVNGKAYFKKCPKGLHFNRETQRCDIPCNASCDPTLSCKLRLSQKSTEVSPIEDDEDSRENKLKNSFNCLNDGLFAHPDYCNAYIQCTNRRAYVKTCPLGLHFRKKTKRCVPACLAKCDPTISCSSRSSKTFHEEVDCVQEPDIGTCHDSLTRFYFDVFSGQCLEFEYGGCEGNSNNFETMEECENKCMKKLLKSTEVPPTEDDKAGVLGQRQFFECPTYFGSYAHPVHCNQYFECILGIPSLRRCPIPTMHFWNVSQNCEVACLAKCDPTIYCGKHLSQITEASVVEEITTPDSEPTFKKMFKLKVKFVCFDDGLFPHSKDCRKYVNCSDGNSYEQSCPPGKHFNNETKRCEAPCSAKCDPNLVCGWRKFKDNLHESLFKEVVDGLCSRDAVYTSPVSCEMYFKCENGDVNAYQCPEGQHFNNKTSQCEDPCDAHCESSIAEKCGWKEDTNESERKYIMKNEELCIKSGSYKQSNPKDCETYFRCENGDSLLLYCPDGQHFNQETLRCEQPCEAKCDSSMTEECGWDHTTESENGISLKQPMFDFECPGDGLFANIVCENFIQCTGGQAYLINCPQGQHYNPYTKECTTPCEARCLPNYETYCTDEVKHYAPKHLLKDFDCETDGYHANPLDCGSFIQCFRGSAYEIQCAADLHYSPTLEICMTPCDAKCAPNYEEYCIDEPWNHAPKHILKDFDCETDGYHVNPLDCGSFIQCFRGTAYAIQCPADLHYSPTLEICMTPCDAKCAPNYEDYCIDEEWNRRKRPLLRSNSVKQPFPLVSELICTEDGLYSNPEECTSYIQCMNGESIIKPCPEGLHYNDKKQKCESPCNAHCDSSIGSACGWDESWAPTENSQDTTFNYEMFLAANSPGLMYHFTCMKDGIYKNPENCTTFIQCAGGHSYIMACPPGLHFSEQTKGCHYPCDAHCDTNLACDCGWDTCGHNEETSDEIDCEAEPEEGPCEGRLRRYAYDAWSGRCRGFVYGGCEGNSNNFKTLEECENKCQKKLLKGFRCPEDNGMFGHYPDCMSYYHCKRGIPILKKCPKGTAFDHKKSKCVTEYEATCVYVCRDKDAVYPYEENCHKYIDCVNGISKLEKCPQGKAFDPTEKDCVEEKLVDNCFWSEK